MSKIVHVKYCCNYCQRPLTDSTRLRNHLSKIHNIHVPSISRGKRRFDTQSITYVNKLGYGQNQDINEEYGCPSCYSHFPEIDSLHSHIQEAHVK
ncbi:hypothetical protein BDF20DRAFT_806486, partial [Mycotypha africana]|uniref:uncharacterized protein n=1 Tax=Mycotypha africana TaxID=64632 RepID=UPI0023012296